MAQWSSQQTPDKKLVGSNPFKESLNCDAAVCDIICIIIKMNLSKINTGYNKHVIEKPMAKSKYK
jgi:hypothetical protein